MVELSESARQTARNYAPVLNGLHPIVEEHLGSLLWQERQDTTIADDDALGEVVRVGPVVAMGVALSTIDVQNLQEALAAYLRQYSFQVGPLRAMPNGELELTAEDAHHARFTLRCRGRLRCWIDVPAVR